MGHETIPNAILSHETTKDQQKPEEATNLKSYSNPVCNHLPIAEDGQSTKSTGNTRTAWAKTIGAQCHLRPSKMQHSKRTPPD